MNQPSEKHQNSSLLHSIKILSFKQHNILYLHILLVQISYTINQITYFQYFNQCLEESSALPTSFIRSKMQNSTTNQFKLQKIPMLSAFLLIGVATAKSYSLHYNKWKNKVKVAGISSKQMLIRKIQEMSSKNMMLQQYLLWRFIKEKISFSKKQALSSLRLRIFQKNILELNDTICHVSIYRNIFLLEFIEPSFLNNQLSFILRQILIESLLQIDRYLAFFINIRMQKGHIHQIDFLYNDLYQFTCSFTYFQAKKHQDEATFEVFFRKHPFHGQYAIFAGLQEVRKVILNFKIHPYQQAFLRKTLPSLTTQYFQWLKQDFSSLIKVKAFKEGQIVFAREPLISYTGPLSFVQILQTPILNLLGFATLVTTNASRMVKATSPKKCVQFGMRRAQGPDGGLTASAYAYLGGFQGTSNMKASQIFNIPCIGTMSHAFVTSFTSLNQIEYFYVGDLNIVQRALQIRKQFGWFKTNDGELAAFLSYAKTFSQKFNTLIDTYSDLESGLLNTIIVAKALSQAGMKQFGIRLDSGDLCQLSKRCRQVWLKYMPQFKFTIYASDDLYEERLVQIQKNESQVDIYAIGTNIASCKKQPALGLVCKLTKINGISRMKLSADPQKATLPADKAVYRVWINNLQKSSFDLIALEGEQILLGENKLFSLKKEQIQMMNVTKFRRMNQKLNLLQFTHTIKQNRQRIHESMSQLAENLFALQVQTSHPILLTQSYLKEFKKVRQALHQQK